MWESEDLSGAVIGAAIAVHRALGPGFLESIYQRALAVELVRRKIAFSTQVEVHVEYEGVRVGTHRFDLLVDETLVVELKASADIHSTHRAQLSSYLRASGAPIGLLLNFGQPTLQIRRITNQ